MKKHIRFWCKKHKRTLNGTPVFEQVKADWIYWYISIDNMECYEEVGEEGAEETTECRKKWIIVKAF